MAAALAGVLDGQHTSTHQDCMPGIKKCFLLGFALQSAFFADSQLQQGSPHPSYPLTFLNCAN
jgi:hypothetical protein